MRPIPTLAELQTVLSNDFKNKLNIFSEFLKKTLDAFTSVISAQLKILYLYLSDVQNNAFPDTADIEANGGTLERFGRIYLNRNLRPATIGVYELNVTGVAASVLRSGLTFKSNEDAKNPGQLFVLDAEYIMTGTDDVIEVRSLGSGTSFLLDANDNLTITEPVLGVDKTVTVETIVTQPKAAEDIEVYRQAILDAIQLEAQGGAKTDYRLWASDAQGVRKVYPYVKNGFPGIVQIFTEATILDSTDGYGTPSPTLLTEVEDVINLDPDVSKPIEERGRRPIQAELEVLAITLVPVDIEITGLNVDTVSIRASIDNNLTNYIYGVRPFVDGGELLRNKNDVLFSSKLQGVATDVLDNGNFFANFVMLVDGNAENSYLFELGNIPFVNSITYS